MTARNSIFESVDGEAIRADGSGNANVAEISIDHSNFNKAPVATGGGDASVIQGSGNQTTAPAFVNRAVSDFREQPGSVTIDGGTADPDLGSLDYYGGEPRILDVRPDIGADELDVAAPRTAITRRPNRKIHRRRARVRFISNEPGSTFQCKLDNGRFRGCRSPKRLRGLLPGRHVFKVRAVDKVGRPDPTPAVVRFRVCPAAADPRKLRWLRVCGSRAEDLGAALRSGGI